MHFIYEDVNRPSIMIFACPSNFIPRLSDGVTTSQSVEKVIIGPVFPFSDLQDTLSDFVFRNQFESLLMPLPQVSIAANSTHSNTGVI
jgi:hypothetical protein